VPEHPEIKAAQEALDNAVRELIRVCANHGEPLIGDDTKEAFLSGYVMVLDGTSYNEEGDTVTSIGHVYDGGQMPLPQAVGLMKLGMWSLLEGPVRE
jgi:hypothetical protein